MKDAFTYSYDPLSRLSGLARPNSVTTAYDYDNAGRLSRARHVTGAGQALEDYQYTYTADNHIASVTSLASATLLPPTRTASNADAANRVSQFGNASYTFNEQGQLTSKTDGSGTTQYSWDARGRLKQADLPDGRAVGLQLRRARPSRQPHLWRLLNAISIRRPGRGARPRERRQYGRVYERRP